MRAKQILDAFSETLMQDDRILNSRERELLMSLLQNAKTVSGNPETREAVKAAIARSVGETVAQRAFGLLGGSIVEQILARSEISTEVEGTGRDAKVELRAPQPPSGPQDVPATPQPPTSAPQPPGASQPVRAPQPPSSSRHEAWGRSRRGRKCWPAPWNPAVGSASWKRPKWGPRT